MTPGGWFAIAIVLVVSGLLTIAWSFRKAARRRGLKNARSRVVIGLALIGLGLAARLGPMVQSRGVAGLTPTGVLLSRLQPEDRPAVGGWEEGRPMVQELARRMEADVLTADQRRRLATWQLEGVQVEGVVRTRRHWPRGVAPTFEIDVAAFFGLADRELRLRADDVPMPAAIVDVSEWRRDAGIPPRSDRLAGYWSDWYRTDVETPALQSFEPDAGEARLTLELWESGEVVWRDSGTVPFERVAGVGEALSGVDGAADASRVREGIGLSLYEAGPRRWYVGVAPAPGLCEPPMGIALTIELLWRGRVAATLEGLVVCGGDGVAFGSHTAVLEPAIGAADPRDAGWTLRVRGVADGLLEDIDVSRWWSGQFAVPVVSLIRTESSGGGDGSARPARPD
ncbi:MAG: hypothetical protein RIB32_02705 [Phycisphaerales bacterium]